MAYICIKVLTASMFINLIDRIIDCEISLLHTTNITVTVIYQQVAYCDW